MRKGKGRYLDTHIVTFAPRYLLDNRSSHKLAFSQREFVRGKVGMHVFNVFFFVLCLRHLYYIIKDRKMNDNVLFVMITCCRVQQIQRDISPPCQAPVWCSTGLEMTTISFSVSVSWMYPTAPGLEVLRSTSLNLSTST